MADLSGWTIGVIGLGHMGVPMARNLARAGAAVHVASRSPEPVAMLAAEGMTPHRIARTLAAAVDTVIVMVTDTDAVDRVLHGPDGVVAGLAPGKLVIDMSTTKVRETRQWAAEVEAAGCGWLDAPVSGGQVGAEQATLAIMAGGSDESFARALPLFQTLGRNVTHIGGTGAGQVCKAANQVIVGVTLAAVAEALTLAAKAGVDPAKVRTALRSGFADSRVLELHGLRMIERNFAPGGHATVQLKDLNQVLELADQLGIALPTIAANRELWQKLVDMGHGKLDQSGIIRAVEDA